ncbi:MAG: hypothetical protein V1696_03485 [Candidatus Jorgensenbacteria bacterium]
MREIRERKGVEKRIRTIEMDNREERVGRRDMMREKEFATACGSMLGKW